MSVDADTQRASTGRPARPRIVVGVDGSEQSKLALCWGRWLAVSTGAELEAVIAWQYPVATGWGSAAMPLNYNPERDMGKLLSDTAGTVFGADWPAQLKPNSHRPAAHHCRPPEQTLPDLPLSARSSSVWVSCCAAGRAAPVGLAEEFVRSATYQVDRRASTQQAGYPG